MIKSFEELVQKARTCRRFYRDQVLSEAQLESLVDLARIAPNSRNEQSLRYITVNNPELCAQIYPHIVLGGAFKASERPSAEEAPAAFILILSPKEFSVWSGFDIGIAAQTIQLAATDKGLAACMVGAYNGEKIMELLLSHGLQPTGNVNFCDNNKTATQVTLIPRLLIALGVPSETREIVPTTGNNTTYYRENAVHKVPKRSLEDVLIFRA